MVARVNPFRQTRYARAVADGVKLAAEAPDLEASAVVPQLASPFSLTPSALSSVVWADLLGTDTRILDRAGAMSLPAVARQRHLITGALARCPLQVLTGDTADAAQPRWPSRTDGAISPYHRMLWTADDCLFYGWSLWRAGRVGDALDTANRVPYEDWSVDDFGRVLIHDKVVPAASVILIPGPHEGILNFGARSILMALENASAASRAARNPSAYLELHYTGDEELTEEQITFYRTMWAEARRGDMGGVAWTNKVIELKEHGTHEAHLLIDGRNADAVDMSRLVSSPAAMADATNAGASLTYETSQGRNGEFIDYGVGLYMDSIAARLSMDDVVASGKRVAFDTSAMRDLAPSPTGTPTED